MGYYLLTCKLDYGYMFEEESLERLERRQVIMMPMIIIIISCVYREREREREREAQTNFQISY